MTYTGALPRVMHNNSSSLARVLLNLYAMTHLCAHRAIHRGAAARDAQNPIVVGFFFALRALSKSSGCSRIASEVNYRVLSLKETYFYRALSPKETYFYRALFFYIY